MESTEIFILKFLVSMISCGSEFHSKNVCGIEEMKHFYFIFFFLLMSLNIFQINERVRMDMSPYTMHLLVLFYHLFVSFFHWERIHWEA